MAKLVEFVRSTFEKFNMPSISWTDVIEIIVIAYLVYKILIWFKKTRAWSLMKGIFVIGAFLLIAEVLEMNTILWIAGKLFTIMATVLVVVFQPELRKALESLGNRDFLSKVLPFETAKVSEGRFSDRTINELIRACNDMARVKTGALIVIEQNNSLADIERTGIAIDGVVSSQLLINIFE
nr:diadenylate cyclase [Lachnospiraceae bacterium]